MSLQALTPCNASHLHRTPSADINVEKGAKSTHTDAFITSYHMSSQNQFLIDTRHDTTLPFIAGMTTKTIEVFGNVWQAEKQATQAATKLVADLNEHKCNIHTVNSSQRGLTSILLKSDPTLPARGGLKTADSPAFLPLPAAMLGLCQSIGLAWYSYSPIYTVSQPAYSLSNYALQLLMRADNRRDDMLFSC